MLNVCIIYYNVCIIFLSMEYLGHIPSHSVPHTIIIIVIHYVIHVHILQMFCGMFMITEAP